MRNHRIEDNSGVLISGPNGVGKSTVGLITAYACIASRLLVVFIPSAHAWVASASKGAPDTFFLELFVKQNADMICASDVLYPVFSEYFHGRKELDGETMSELETVLKANPALGVGVIVDEVQAISDEVLYPTKAEIETRYFRYNWHNWIGGLGPLFVRMDIASSNGDGC